MKKKKEHQFGWVAVIVVIRSLNTIQFIKLSMIASNLIAMVALIIVIIKLIDSIIITILLLLHFLPFMFISNCNTSLTAIQSTMDSYSRTNLYCASPSLALLISMSPNLISSQDQRLMCYHSQISANASAAYATH